MLAPMFRATRSKGGAMNDEPSPGIIGAATRELRLTCTAWVFFTRVPLPSRLANWVGYTPDMLRASARYFPLVGILIGGIGAAVFLAAATFLPPGPAVVLSMMASVLMTGAFHEDGFADSCDGFGGGYTRERVLDIMQDSRVGAFGAIGIALMLLLKFSTLEALAASVDAALVAWVMVLGHALSRTASVALMLTLDYVRVDTGPKAKPLAEGISGAAFAVACAITLAPFAALAHVFENGAWMLAGLLPVALATWGAGAYFSKRIGGFTGDCLGAAQQVAEVVFYLFAAALLLGFEASPA
jgi:adenosylcobinamide-GDP ribazoletransferase